MRHLDCILITRAGDERWPRYQAKSLACPGCDSISMDTIPTFFREISFLFLLLTGCSELFLPLPQIEQTYMGKCKYMDIE